MRRLFLCSALAVAFLSCAAPALNAQTPEQAFRDAVLHKQMYLRDFSAEDRISGEWKDDHLSLPSPSVRTFAVFIADSVKVKSDYVELSGKRITLLRKNDKEFGLPPVVFDARIRIGFLKGTADMALPQIEQTLFFPSSKAALDAIPKGMQKMVPGKFTNDCCTSTPAEALDETCDCADTGTNGCAENRSDFHMKGSAPPRVKRSVEPNFSEDARAHKISGDVLVGLEIDGNGPAKPLAASASRLWVGRQCHQSSPSIYVCAGNVSW